MPASASRASADGMSPVNVIRLLIFHATALLVFWVGISWPAFLVFIAAYLLRSFAISAGYHRYFSHQSFRTSRGFQFVLAALGCTSGQRGPLSWATSHRLHHQHADHEGDPHSPVLEGFWHAHLGWFLQKDPLPTGDPEIRRFEDTPEILWLNRHHGLVFLLYLAALYGLGWTLAFFFPETGATGAQFVVWGGIISTLLILHATCLINSVTHICGRRDYPTPDGSRNVAWLFPLTFGENWHNTHHRYPWSANTGLKAGHSDWIFAVLRLLERFHIVHDVKDAKARDKEDQSHI